MTDKTTKVLLLLLTLPLLLLSGCAAKLTPAGARVREVVGADRVRASCEFLGVVEGNDSAAVGEAFAAGLEGRPSSYDPSRRRRGADAVRRVRNQVAELGGDAFLEVGWDGETLQAEAYDCGTEAPPQRVGA